ncbi:Tyrosine-protein phosphatase non-receptor type 61F, partial [Eumeta japonica]
MVVIKDLYRQVTRAKRKYILAQGPLAQTVSHFWLMIWEQNSETIIMLNKIIENNEIKCHWYWPDQNGEIKRFEFPDVNIAVIQLSEEDRTYYIIRKF